MLVKMRPSVVRVLGVMLLSITVSLFWNDKHENNFTTYASWRPDDLPMTNLRSHDGPLRS